MQQLKVLGSVLYIAAHPDDENTRLLAYLANGKQYRTGYLSLTRGDGGQNLIGDEQGIDLGLIRTNELMAARSIDGAQQFFTRAYDFGFSKSPAETFTKWNHEQVLSDVVWVVRKFKPDVIIARFPEDGRAGHGHHSASGILAREAFDAAADPLRFPEQLSQGVQVWQAKRMLWNTFSFGGNSTIDSTQFQLDAGGFNPYAGESYGELAGQSRSQHKSQGFGVPKSRGTQREFFVPIKGDAPKVDLLDGVDITWNRLLVESPLSLPVQEKRSKKKVESPVEKIENAIDNLIEHFKSHQPSASVPELIELHQQMQTSLPESYWRKVKLAEVEALLQQCTGLYAEATVPVQWIAENDSVKVNLNLINRSNVLMKAIHYQFNTQKIPLNIPLLTNQNVVQSTILQFPLTIEASQPFWLLNGLKDNLFDIKQQQLIGQPLNAPISVKITLSIVDKDTITIECPIQYKYIDPVKGEIYQPIIITPRHMISSANDIILFKKGTNQEDSATINIKVTSFEKNSAANAEVAVTGKGISLHQKDPKFTSEPNSTMEYVFKLGNYGAATESETDELSMEFITNGNAYKQTQRSIAYDHIPLLRRYYVDKIKVLHIDLQTIGKKIGYIEGAGDRVPEALAAMGYDVVIVKEMDITPSLLQSFDAIVTGVRAYNVHEYLSGKFPILMQYVQQGGNLIVQYNTSSNIGPVKSKMSPFALQIGRSRVTDEQSPVQFLLPEHPVLNYPNKITQKDFEGWVQERSIYHAQSYDTAFSTPIGFTDFKEPMEKSSLLIAPYGKGNFVYTGIVFFRELPAGVAGAFRLMANLIALPKH